MRPRQLGVRLLLPAVLVGLVGWLAALEYHWLDQVSQADREERLASLQSHAEEFAADFDRELSRLHVFLDNAGPSVQSGTASAFAKRYDAWHDSARDPQILRAIYWVRSDAATIQPSVEEYHPATKTFTPVPWPEALLPLRPTTPMPVIPPGMPLAVTPLVVSRDEVTASVPAVISPIPAPSDVTRTVRNSIVSMTLSSNLLVAYLDRNYLRSTFLPALAVRYFPPRGVDPYRLAVINPQHPDAPIMTADWPAGAPVDPKHADASVPIFTLRADLTSPFVQRALMNDLAPTSEVLGDGRGGAGGRVVAGYAAATTAANAGGGGVVTSAPSSQSTFRLVVQTQTIGPTTASATGAAGPSIRFVSRPADRWELVLQHSAGSLDAAVNQARRRNLWLSFGLLSVLASGVVLIVTNARRAERLATQQMDFVATVSHELRTPLAVIRSAAQNLSAGVVGDPARARQYGELIEAEGRRLTEMVEQVLDYAGLGGAPRPTAARLVDLGAIAAEILAACQPLATAAGVELESHVPADLPAVMGDETALRSAIENLVSNALKYGADGRWVRLEMRPDGPDVQVTVADRGLGIDANDRPHLFDPFYRGQRAKDTQVHGNGLGLSLVKRIVEAHGGRIGVDSTPGAGATFKLVLPAARAAASSSLAVGLDPAAVD